MARPDDFDMQKVVEYLQGTCMNSLEDGIQVFYPDMTEDDLTDDDRSYFDNELFSCDQCGWWCETSSQCAEFDSCCDTGYCTDCCEETHEED